MKKINQQDTFSQQNETEQKAVTNFNLFSDEKHPSKQNDTKKKFDLFGNDEFKKMK